MKTNLLKMAVIIMTLVMTTSLSASRKLCLIGDATRSGWSSGDASPMIQDATNPAVFHYDAWLNAVITSYSIHYTKLYEQKTNRIINSLLANQDSIGLL